MKKAVGYSVSVVTKTKRYGEYLKGYLTKEQALKLAMQVATTSNKVEIDREYEITRYGDVEADSRPYGVMQKVKRKSGYVYVLKTVDSYGWESWTYDVTPDLKLRNRR